MRGKATPKRVRTEGTADWSPAEEQVLRAAVEKYGTNQWGRVASLLPNKAPSQCQEHFYNHLDPALKGAGGWSVDEDRLLLQLGRTLSAQWQTVALLLPGRTAEACAQRYTQLTQTLDRNCTPQVDHGVPELKQDPDKTQREVSEGRTRTLPALQRVRPPDPDAAVPAYRDGTSPAEREMLKHAGVRLYGNPDVLVSKSRNANPSKGTASKRASQAVEEDVPAGADSIFATANDPERHCVALLVSKAWHEIRSSGTRPRVPTWDPNFCAMLAERTALRDQLCALMPTAADIETDSKQQWNVDRAVWSGEWIYLPTAVGAMDLEEALAQARSTPTDLFDSSSCAKGDRPLRILSERKHRLEALACIHEALRALFPPNPLTRVSRIPRMKPSAETVTLIDSALAEDDAGPWLEAIREASTQARRSSSLPSSPHGATEEDVT
ncbi:CDC5 cell division cycle 5-like protein [Cyanidiococcus yangmingshanensis]|uniref:CDC5 cell division cycle 5-like protein n=1 Tax=Cyanidiococcus yangmingshanensis TaxID=2690220 RepID=A0A7J7INL6_9RHOD|nr:CDC5 cell division cycle 5-like protein [Cyanidiococcus yangmingshanensis]